MLSSGEVSVWKTICMSFSLSYNNMSASIFEIIFLVLKSYAVYTGFTQIL